MELSLCWHCIAQGLLLAVAANGAPVAVRKLLDERFQVPVDLGVRFVDGHPLFGRAKTWRGLFAAVAAAAAAAPLLGLDARHGALFGVWAMVGDLLASFVKRRFGLAASHGVPGLDEIPEALLPAAALGDPLGLGIAEIAFVVAGFWLIDVVVSPVLFRWRMRRRPY